MSSRNSDTKPVSCGCLRCLGREEDEESKRKLRREGVADSREVEGHSEMDKIEDSERDPLPFHADFADFLKSEQSRIGVGPAVSAGGEMLHGSFMSPDSVRRMLCKQAPKDIFISVCVAPTIVIEVRTDPPDRDRRDRNHLNAEASRKSARAGC